MTDARPTPEAFLDLLSGASRQQLWLPVLSGSMAPTLIPGDKALVEPCRAKDCRTGDIIVFRRRAALLSHRLIFKFTFPRFTFLFQQGDGMDTGAFITPESVIGRCILRERDGKAAILTERKENRGFARKQRARMIRNTAKGAIKWMLRKTSISR